MKILLIHPDRAIRNIIRQQFEEAGHVVIHETDDFVNLVLRVAKYRPHAFLALPPSAEILEGSVAAMAMLGLKVKAYSLPPAVSLAALTPHLELILSALMKPELPASLVPYVYESRTILIDDAYPVSGKQNLPGENESTEEHLAKELGILGQQVERATSHHAAASRYLSQVLVIDRGLRTEIAYRAVHSSFKIFWLREHICRWLGVLAHYLPGVELAYLLPPTPPSPQLDFLHFSAPPESWYTLTAVLNHGIKPSWTQPLHDVIEKRYSGQDEEALLQEALILSGWSALLREIALAQVRVMDCALDPDVPWYKDKLPPRRLHRATGIYCDFWHLRHLRENPQHLRPVADGVLRGVKTPGTLPVVPPFRHFVHALGQGSFSLPPAERREG